MGNSQVFPDDWDSINYEIYLMPRFSATSLMSRRVELPLSVMSAAGMLLIYLLVLILPESDQSALTGALVVCSVIFTCSWCLPAARNKFDGRIDWLHPAVLVVLVYFAYFIFPGVWLWLVHDYDTTWVFIGSNKAYLVNTAFILGAISMLAFGLGCRSRFPFPGAKLNNNFYQADALRFKEARYVIIFLLTVGLLAKLYHLSLFGPLSLDLLRYLSPTARRETGISLSQFILLLESMLDWALLLAIFFFLMRYLQSRATRKYLIFLAAFAICVVLLDYLVSAKRSGVILLLILPFIWYSYLAKRLTLAKALVWLSVGGGLIGLLLIVRIALPLMSNNLVASDYIGEDIGGVLQFYFNQPEWASFEMMLASINQREELLENAGGTVFGFLQYTFGTLIAFVPRVIWPGKPEYEDLSHVYFQTIFGVDLGVGIAPTIWGATYMLFHVPGLAIGMYILGWMFKGVYGLLRPYEGRPFDVFFYGIFFWISFQFLRFGTASFVFLYFIQAILVGVIVALFLARKVQGNKN